jgi:arabinose-5-phosphate isomerase
MDNTQNNTIINNGKQAIENEILALNNAKELLGENFVKAVKMVAESKKLVVTGVGKSGIIGKKIAATFSSIGLPAHSMHSVDALHGDIGIIQKGDTVIMLSKSGSTDEIVRLMPFIKSRNANTISIVSDENSYLALHSDVTILVPIESEACPLNIVPTSSTTAALAIGDALAVAVMKLKNISIEDFSKQHPLGQIGRNITLQVKDIMHSGKKIPQVINGELFKNAIIEMSNKKLGCVCVTNIAGQLSGILTDGDVRRTLQKYDNLKELKVDEVMSQHPSFINPNVFLGEALSQMSNRDSQISVLAVVDENGKLVGVIRIHDIIRSGM